MKLNTPFPTKAQVLETDGAMSREWLLFFQKIYQVLQSPEVSGLNMVGVDLYWRDGTGVNHLLVDVP